MYFRVLNQIFYSLRYGESSVEEQTFVTINLSFNIFTLLFSSALNNSLDVFIKLEIVIFLIFDIVAVCLFADERAVF